MTFHKRLRALCLPAVLGLIGCAQPLLPPPAQPQPDRESERATLTRGLIDDKDPRLTGEAIAELLASKIVLTKDPNLAIANLGHQSFDDERRSYRPHVFDAYIDTEDLEFQRSQLKATRSSVERSVILGEVVAIPSLILPEAPGLTELREVAALLQAELLLIHRSRSQIVHDPAVSHPSEFTARVELEAALLDVKTGAIVLSNAYDTTKTVEVDGRNVQAARKSAELQALEEAAGHLGDDIIEYLEPLVKE